MNANTNRIRIALTLLLFLTASIGFSNQYPYDNNLNKDYKFIEKKIIDANFDVESDYNLNLNGRFSDYKIVTWEENSISFHVEITAKSNKESVTKDLLSKIDIDFDNIKAKKTIVANTIINNKSLKNVGFEIDYYIMIPKDLYIKINNSYGNIDIDKVNKDLDIDLDFGNFSIDSLFSYGNINIDYSNAKIKYAEKLDCKIAFSNIRVNAANEINTEAQYSEVKLGKINSLTADSQFGEIDIDLLTKKSIITSKYGDIEINNLDENFELIDIISEFSDVEIYLSENHNFSYDISASFGDIKNKIIKDKATRYIKETNKTTIIGNINDSDNTHQINVKVNFGDVDIELKK